MPDAAVDGFGSAVEPAGGGAGVDGSPGWPVRNSPDRSVHILLLELRERLHDVIVAAWSPAKVDGTSSSWEGTTTWRLARGTLHPRQ